MFDDLTWDALLHAWPWSVLRQPCRFAVGLFVALKPKRQAENAAKGAYKKDWTLTGRIDFADSQSLGALVLEVEETRISISPSGVEHRAFRWRRATIPEAKMIIQFYHAQQNLPMSGTFAATVTDVTLVPREVIHAQFRR
jgi:hypothetical protein